MRRGGYVVASEGRGGYETALLPLHGATRVGCGVRFLPRLCRGQRKEFPTGEAAMRLRFFRDHNEPTGDGWDATSPNRLGDTYSWACGPELPATEFLRRLIASLK